MLENEIVYVPSMDPEEFRYSADDGEDLSALCFAVHPSAGCLCILVDSWVGPFPLYLIGWEQVGSYPLFVYYESEGGMYAYVISPSYLDLEFGWHSQELLGR